MFVDGALGARKSEKKEAKSRQRSDKSITLNKNPQGYVNIWGNVNGKTKMWKMPEEQET